MKKMISLIALCLAMVMTIGLGSIAFASETNETPSTAKSDSIKSKHSHKDKDKKKNLRVNVIAITATVTGQSEDSVKEHIKTGKIGDLLIKAGKLEEFKAAYLAETKVKLDAAVTAGIITQAQADEKYAEVQKKMAAYDGTTHLCGDSDHSKKSKDGKKPATDFKDTN